jgi:hypothetical protein
MSLVECIECCQEGLSAAPDQPRLAAICATALLLLGRADEAIQTLKPVLAANPDPDTASQLANAFTYSPSAEPEEVLAAHAAFGRFIKHALPGRPLPPQVVRDPERRLRVGLLSPDLREHACRFFLEGVLEFYDRDRLEIIAYYPSTQVDAASERLRALATRDGKGGWVDLPNVSMEDLAARIRRDSVDIPSRPAATHWASRWPRCRRARRPSRSPSWAIRTRPGCRKWTTGWPTV